MKNIFDNIFLRKFFWYYFPYIIFSKNLNRDFHTKIPGVFSTQNFAAAACSSSSSQQQQPARRCSCCAAAAAASGSCYAASFMTACIDASCCWCVRAFGVRIPYCKKSRVRSIWPVARYRKGQGRPRSNIYTCLIPTGPQPVIQLY